MAEARTPELPAATAESFTQQLSAPGYVLDLRPGSREAARDQPRSYQRDEPAARQAQAQAGATPSVVLLSRSRDAELDAVGGLLSHIGIPVARLNADQLAAADVFVDPARRAVRLDGRWLAPTITWNRHFSVRAIDGTGSAVRDLFTRESWAAVASQLAAVSEVSMGSRDVGIADQQVAARRQQIAMPRTVITTDVSRAQEFLGATRLVIKAAHQHFVEASPGRLTGIFPVIVAHHAPPSVPGPGIPVTVQEYAEHDRELRVYYVAGEVHAFEVRKRSPAELWLAADRVEVTQVEPPGPVVSATRHLMAGLGLRFGALDFLVRADGDPVFLEVNPDGDWRWAEDKSGTEQVTMAVTRMLRHLHLAACHSRPIEGSHSCASFDLLRFLSARSAPRPVQRRRAVIEATSPGASTMTSSKSSGGSGFMAMYLASD